MSPAVDGDLYFYGLLLKNVAATSEADLFAGVRVDKQQWKYREACYRRNLIKEDYGIVTEMEDEYLKKAFTSGSQGHNLGNVHALLAKVEASRVAAGDQEIDEDGFFSWEKHLATADVGSTIDEAGLNASCVMASRVPV